jgi:hypothetical protein
VWRCTQSCSRAMRGQERGRRLRGRRIEMREYGGGASCCSALVVFVSGVLIGRARRCRCRRRPLRQLGRPACAVSARPRPLGPTPLSASSTPLHPTPPAHPALAPRRSSLRVSCLRISHARQRHRRPRCALVARRSPIAGSPQLHSTPAPFAPLAQHGDAQEGPAQGAPLLLRQNFGAWCESHS